MSGEGRVGIFWTMPRNGTRQLVTRMTGLPEAEPYGDFLTHPEGHAEVWEAWQALGPARLARLGLPATIATHEYEEFPRGRVVFHRPERRFIVYADRQLHGPAMTARIRAAFGLPEGTRLAADAHYRTTRTPSGEAA